MIRITFDLRRGAALGPLAVLSAALLSACGAASAAMRCRSGLTPSEVREVATLPPGYQWNERLRAECHGREALWALDEEPLGDVDCSVERLSRALRARAAELSAEAVVAKRCVRSGAEHFRISCSATAAAREEEMPLRSNAAADVGHDAAAYVGPAPSAEQVLDLDEPSPLASAAIRVSFDPTEPRDPLVSPLEYARVAELAYLPVNRKPLGLVSARCEGGCGELSLRHALRITAGRVGASDIAQVRCFHDDGAGRCVGTAARPWSF